MAMPIAIRFAPRSPSASRMTAEAGVVVAASPLGAEDAQADDVHADVDRDHADDAGERGRWRGRAPGRFSSADMKLAVCQPP